VVVKAGDVLVVGRWREPVAWTTSTLSVTPEVKRSSTSEALIGKLDILLGDFHLFFCGISSAGLADVWSICPRMFSASAFSDAVRLGLRDIALNPSASEEWNPDPA